MKPKSDCGVKPEHEGQQGTQENLCYKGKYLQEYKKGSGLRPKEKER